MLIPRPILERVVAGEVDLVFRRWKRPTVKAGGTLRTVVGVLAIHEVEVVDPASIDDEQARRSGATSADGVRSGLFRPTTSTRARVARPDETSEVYRVRVSYLGDDPRAALRSQKLSRSELADVAARVLVMDARAARPWAVEALRLIKRWPARRAPELAEIAGWETTPWKANVRRLKELGLTESLPVGYRLSPRGEQVLAAVKRRQGTGTATDRV